MTYMSDFFGQSAQQNHPVHTHLIAAGFLTGSVLNNVEQWLNPTLGFLLTVFGIAWYAVQLYESETGKRAIVRWKTFVAKHLKKSGAKLAAAAVVQAAETVASAKTGVDKAKDVAKAAVVVATTPGKDL